MRLVWIANLDGRPAKSTGDFFKHRLQLGLVAADFNQSGLVQDLAEAIAHLAVRGRAFFLQRDDLFIEFSERWWLSLSGVLGW
jgi:hypothetical protein